LENKTQLLFVEKKTPITFRPKITPGQVRAAQAEDALKPSKELGAKEVPPKAPKRHRKPKEPGDLTHPEITDETSPENKPEETKPEKKEPKELPKEKKSKTKELTFPIDGFINGYGFLKLKKALLDKLGWNWKPGKGNRTLVTLDVQDGVLILKKKNA